MITYDVIIIGGGAAGMFAAAVLAERAPSRRVLVLEKGAKPLAKVRVSGGDAADHTHGSKRAGANETTEWGGCPLTTLRRIAAQATVFMLPISGKNRHREEFVTCGGIRLKEVDFRTMQSRLHPGLYLAGEVLDIDALTGGYNLQAAWTTAHIAAEGILAGENWIKSK